MNLFGETLKICRQERGLSVREACRQIGVSPTTITNLEGGKTGDPRASMILKFCAFYNLQVGPMVRMLDSNKTIDKSSE